MYAGRFFVGMCVCVRQRKWLNNVHFAYAVLSASHKPHTHTLACISQLNTDLNVCVCVCVCQYSCKLALAPRRYCALLGRWSLQFNAIRHSAYIQRVLLALLVHMYICMHVCVCECLRA